MIYRSRRARVVLAAALTTALLGLTPSVITGSAQALDLDIDTAFAPQLVTVDTPTRADKELLQTLGLDLTEHAGHDYVEVVLHTGSDAAALQESGLTYDVRIGNLLEREAHNNQVNAAYAAATLESPLPSGRDSYRTLDDYNDRHASAGEPSGRTSPRSSSCRTSHSTARPSTGSRSAPTSRRPRTAVPCSC